MPEDLLDAIRFNSLRQTFRRRTALDSKKRSHGAIRGIPDFAYPGTIPTLPIAILVNRRDLDRASGIFRRHESAEVEP